MLQERDQVRPVLEPGGRNGAGRAAPERWTPDRPALVAALVLLLIPLALLLPRLLLGGGHSLEMLGFPWQIDYDEGVILHSSWLLANGQNPYPANTPGMFVSSVYPPLFYAVNALALKLFGLNLWSGRLLSLLGALLASIALWGWVRAESGSRYAGLVAALFWLALGPVIVWATFYKQDILALGFGALGGWMVAAAAPVPVSSYFTRPARRDLGRTTYWAILPFLLAFWTKQTAVAPLAAAGLYLLLRDWRSGLRWCLLAGAALVVPYLALDLLLGGNLTAHLFAPGAAALSTDRLARNLGAMWGEYAALVVLGAFGLIAALVNALRHWNMPPLSAIFGLVSIPAGLLFNMLPIANYNHLINLLLPICLLCGTLVSLLIAVRGRQRWVQTAALALVMAALSWQALNFAPLAWWYSPLGQPLAAKAQRMERIDQLVAQTPGTMLSEDNWLLLKNGKQVLYDDPAAMATYGGGGRWDNSTLLADIGRRKFALVILEYDLDHETYNPRWQQPLLDALKANYATLFRDVRFVHTPRPAPAAAPQSLGCRLAGGPNLTGLFLPLKGRVLNPGDAAQLSLYWRGASGPREPNLKTKIQLLNAQGNALWQADVAPGTLAGVPWPNISADQAVRDDFTVQLPQDAATGPYRLALSSYVLRDGAFPTVPFACAQASPDGSITLAAGQIVP